MVMILMTLALFAKMTSVIEEKSAFENQPISATVTVEHEKPVDPSSFMLEGKPLEVTLERSLEVTPPNPLKLSIYRFTLPPKEAGLYVLPPITAKVGDEKQQTIPVSYTVKKASPNESLLTLKPFVQAKQPLYPGQKTEVGYVYYFTYSVDLIQEKVPLLEAQGFEKIGGPTIKEQQEGGVNSVRVSQVVVAQKPGVYRFGPSLIEGRPWRMTPSGQKQFAATTVKSEVPLFEIKVAPFPEKRPKSFNGALGDFTFQVKLLTSDQVKVGERMELQVEVAATGDLDALELPDFCCQSGMSGFFRTSDIPPAGKISGNTKRFILEFYPLSSEVKEIPSLEFSFFNPEVKKFVVRRSKAIPLKVLSEPDQLPTSIPKPVVKPIELKPNRALTSKDLKPLPFGTWRALFLYPFLFSLLAIQWKWKQRKPSPIKSKDVFKKFLKQRLGTSDYYRLMHEAFALKMKEVEPNKASQIQSFLEKVDAARFGKSEHVPTREKIIQFFKDMS